MSNFNNKSITNKGLELLSAAMAGGKLEFTRIVMGSGTYSGDIGVIESLVSQKQSLDIKSITQKGSQVILSTTLLQSAITEDFYWKEIGVYAKGADDLEVLYMYGSATDTSFISKDMLNEKMINVGVMVSNAQNITATIDGSLVYLSRADLEEHNNDEAAHKSLRSWVQGLFDSLKFTWDSITGKPSEFPPSEHTHTTSQITDFPTSLPASDVYAWAKASTKPTYTANEVGALASGGTAVNASKVANAITISLNGTSQGAYDGSTAKSINITASSVGAAASSHTHSASNVSAGTFTGVVVAQTNTSYTTRQVRNIIESTASPSGGANGDVWIKYS